MLGPNHESNDNRPANRSGLSTANGAQDGGKDGAGAAGAGRQELLEHARHPAPVLRGRPSQPPRARRDERAVIEQLGRARIDPYAWLKDDNWKEVMRDPKPVAGRTSSAYLEAENAYTQPSSWSTPTAQLQEKLFEEMKGRDARRMTRPFRRSTGRGPITGATARGASIRSSRRAGRAGLREGSAGEQVLLDGNEQAKGCEYWDVRKISHSPDHRLVAFTVDDKGSEFYTLHRARGGDRAARSRPSSTPMASSSWGEDSAVDLLGSARRECATRGGVLPDAGPRHGRTGLSRERSGLSSSASRKASHGSSSSSPRTITPRRSGAFCGRMMPDA